MSTALSSPRTTANTMKQVAGGGVDRATSVKEQAGIRVSVACHGRETRERGEP